MPKDSGIVFHNAFITTMDDSLQRAKVISALNGVIAYVGDSVIEAEEALVGKTGDASFKEKVKKVDLLGLTVIPGLIDSHSHAIGEGQRLSQLDLQFLSLDDLLHKVATAAKGLQKGKWLHGRGWDNNIWPGGKWPDKEALDEAAPYNPVVLDRLDKHSIWVNSRALELAGVDENTKVPLGGEMLLKPNGKLLGVLLGKAMAPVWAVMPPYDGQSSRDLFLRAQEELLSLGLTTLIDCGTRKADFFMLKDLLDKGDLKLRFRGNVIGDPWSDILDLDRREKLNSDFLAIDGIKLFSDGTLGSRSAWLREEYYDQKGHYGDHNYDDSTLLKIIEKARDRNLQVAIHSIGDRAIEQAMDVMEKALGSSLGERHFRLEHFQVTDPGILNRRSKLGLIPSIQSVGIMYDYIMAPTRLGPKRIKDCYAWKRILDGGYFINGSDAPVESPNPFYGIYAATSRMDLSCQPEGGFQMEDALTLTEAIKSYTIWPSDAAFQAHKLGSLSLDKFCDFVVLDSNIFKKEKRQIADVKVLMSVVNGEIVFEREKSV
jgi:predicted amidohydrolase YtcJ